MRIWPFERSCYDLAMKRASSPKSRLPRISEAARLELLASLQRGEGDLLAGRVKRMSLDEFTADMRADFEKITGYEALNAPVRLDDETRAAIDEGLAQVRRGEFVSDAEIDALWKKHRL